MATTVERLGIVETKVSNLDEKIDDIKIDIKDVHDCLDRTGETIKNQLELMHKDSSYQHDQLASKITELEKFRNKYTTYLMVALAFAAGTGWLNSAGLPNILKFLGV